MIYLILIPFINFVIGFALWFKEGIVLLPKYIYDNTSMERWQCIFLVSILAVLNPLWVIFKIVYYHRHKNEVDKSYLGIQHLIDGIL